MRSLLLLCVTLTLACSGPRRPDPRAATAALAACPSSPNCVSSDAPDAAHRVEAFALAAPPDDAWRVLRDAVESLPRTTLAEATANRLHAECASAVFGFVDDLELELRASENRIAVRSASRVGYSDLGVNRRRVEGLRDVLRARGVVQ